MLLDIRSETSQQSVETHFILVASQSVLVLARIVLQLNESLQQLSILLSELGTVGVLLNLTLALKTFSANALERTDLISQKERVRYLIRLMLASCDLRILHHLLTTWWSSHATVCPWLHHHLLGWASGRLAHLGVPLIRVVLHPDLT